MTYGEECEIPRIAAVPNASDPSRHNINIAKHYTSMRLSKSTTAKPDSSIYSYQETDMEPVQHVGPAGR